MNKKESSDVFDLVQLIISADIILHKYSKLNVKDKIKLIKRIEELKKGV